MNSGDRVRDDDVDVAPEDLAFVEADQLEGCSICVNNCRRRYVKDKGIAVGVAFTEANKSTGFTHSARACQVAC